MKMFASAIVLTVMGCGNDKGRGADDVRVEGTEPGDCTDRADNDGDSLFDCDDDGCANSPDCDADTGGGDDSDVDLDPGGDADQDGLIANSLDAFAIPAEYKSQILDLKEILLRGQSKDTIQQSVVLGDTICDGENDHPGTTDNTIDAFAIPAES